MLVSPPNSHKLCEKFKIACMLVFGRLYTCLRGKSVLRFWSVSLQGNEQRDSSDRSIAVISAHGNFSDILHMAAQHVQ